jgi:hypothetical protein
MFKKLVGGLLLVTVFIAVFKNSSKDNEPKKQLTENQREKICKYYISYLFRGDDSLVPIMRKYNTDNQNLIYVEYTRASDNTLWSNVCDVKGTSVIWAAWLKDDQKWGRWRDEDRMRLSYNNEKQTVSIIRQDGDKAMTFPF